MDWKVGDKFRVIDAEKTGFTYESNGEIGVITSLEYRDKFNDPDDGYGTAIAERANCVYGDLEDVSDCYFVKSCIRPLTKLEKAMK